MTSLATTRAETVTASNGFTHASGGTTVTTDLDTSNGIAVTVTISSPHHNAMAGLLGMPTWMVTTTATALAGFPDTAYGASPFIFPASAFQIDGTPKFQSSIDFGETNGDVPTSLLDFAWTNYGTGNVSNPEVRDIIEGTTTINKTLAFGEYIGQHNNGNHTTLYDPVNIVPRRPGRARGDRRSLRELRRLGHLPREQCDRRHGQAHQRLLQELVRERSAVDHGLLRQ